MKKIPTLLLALYGSITLLPAQTAITSGTTAVNQDTDYQIVQSDGNSQVWQRTTYETAPDGTQIPHVHQYTEVATGLNHWDYNQQQWVPSSEDIAILSDGSGAVATNGQHQAYFPADIYQGEIRMLTPDGKLLRSRPLGLSYDDGQNTVLIASLTNSVGEVVGDNQVIYPNAFVGVDADLLYTYTKAGFEQDVIIRQQPPMPEAFNLSSQNSKLQLLTEFFDPPQPTVTQTALPAQAGMALPDQNLDFGVMQMVPGRAFLLGTDAQEGNVSVSKAWVSVENRQFLLEQVPVMALANELQALPQAASVKVNLPSPLHIVSTKRLLPPQHLAKAGHAPSFMTKATLPGKGLVLDYITMTSQTNYIFRGDTTYYISGTVNLSGANNIFEGGAVLKYATNGVISFTSGSAVQWQTSAYRPVIYTARDDNSVGDSITNLTPSGYYANPALNLNAATINSSIANVRFAYANQAISLYNVTPVIANSQFIRCQNGITFSYCAPITFENDLFANVVNSFDNIASGVMNAQNTTFSGNSYVASGVSYVSLYFTNCIFANVTNLYSGTPNSFTGGYNGFYNRTAFGSSYYSSSIYPFNSVGAGGYYLTNGCSFLNVGTTGIDPTLLTALGQKTTYAPIILSNITVSVNTIISPQAQRDTDTPDLGYHYDPIDYLAFACAFTNNVLLTVTNGAVVAGYDTGALWLQDGSSIVSIGTPQTPNWFVRYQSVQEQPVSLDGLGPSGGYPVSAYHFSNAAPNGTFRFTHFACPAGGGYHLYDYSTPYFFGNLLVQDCEFYGGLNTLGGYSGAVATIKNSLFDRSTISALIQTGATESFTNNLVWGASSVVIRPIGTGLGYVYNNDFDSCSISAAGTVTNGYNAYLNCTNYLSPTNTTDIFSTSALVYQTGTLGTFYQPSGSLLINKGSTNANLLGLYHYTTQTSQVKETNSIVDIGYHYVATDAYGNPIDTDGDGMPDYLEDANGNGIVDTGETSWTNYNSANRLSSPNGLLVFTPLK